MGVYSELAAQRVNEATMLENFQFTDLLEYAINIDRGNQAMFDAMLEMDFHEAYAEKGLISINEGEEKSGFKAAIDKMVQKIKELWEKLVSVATTFMAKMRNVFAQYSGRNKALVKSELSRKQDIVVDLVPDDLEVKFYNGDENFYKTFEVDFSEVTALIDKNVDLETAKAKIKEVFGIDKSIDDYFGNVNLKSALENFKINLSHIEDNLKDPGKVGKNFGESITGSKGLVGLAKDQIKKLKDVKGDDRAAVKDKYAICSCIVKYALTYMNFYRSVIARKLMYERSVYAKCAALVKKAENKKAENGATESTEESSINFTLNAIDFVNETFIEELFV